ncbi:MAG: putative acetamidase/formamidase, partial [Deltaproteobacteria bacterium]|nr:putative acetamidase/formamidase [Deltaproteobacteria bacterium]MBP2684299.1 putative acetamidase/formamidase [Deltaproteobacteria bacterium]
MSGDSEKKKGKESGGIDRRKFLKYAGATGAIFALNDFALPKARAVDLKRVDSTGKVHILGCNEKTSTDGYWDNSTKPVLNIKSG